MDDPTRRDALSVAMAAGAAALAGLAPGTAPADDRAANATQEKLDRERVIMCGFTEAEADCWVSLSQTAAKFLDLPKLHVMDDHEIAHAIHVLQYRLMSRPAYRAYRGPRPAEKKERPD